MIDLITSMNQPLFEQYGRQMVAGFEQFAGPDLRLIIVFEGRIQTQIKLQGNRTLFVPFDSPDHRKFLKYFGHLYEANGLRVVQTPGPNGQNQLQFGWDFRFAAVRFSFKIFAIEIGKALARAESSFAWIDADVRCLKPFSAADLMPFMPETEEIMSYLGRDFFPPANPYSECGFLGFNRRHSELDAYLNRMRTLYTTGEIFSLAEWHDSWLWDEVRREFEAMGNKFRNISGAGAKTEHPFINCGLGEFFDHLKGPVRKQQGQSLDSDYIVRTKPSA
jgi:hypothetical protein